MNVKRRETEADPDQVYVVEFSREELLDILAEHVVHQGGPYLKTERRFLIATDGGYEAIYKLPKPKR